MLGKRLKSILPLLVSFLGLATAAHGVAFVRDLGSFEVPLLTEDPVRARQVQRPDEARIETLPDSKLGPVVRAANTQDAINTAVAAIQAAPPKVVAPQAGASGFEVMGGGVHVIETPSGFGVVGAATAYYDTEQRNPNLVLREQRVAWVEADLAARLEVMRFLKGMSIEARQELASRLELADTDTFSGGNLDRSFEESIDSTVAGYVAGIVTYDVNDDPGAGAVTVTVVTTPKTRGEVRTVSSGLALAGAVDLGLEQITQQLLLGVIPPVGSRVVTVPASGETAWVGFGAEPVTIHANPQLRAAAKGHAKEIARNLAAKALVALISGERLSASSETDSRYTAQVKEFDLMLDDAGTQTVAGVDVPSAQTIYTSMSESQQISVVNGQVPPGTMWQDLESKDGRWVFSIAVYRESTMPLLARGPSAPPAADRDPDSASAAAGRCRRLRSGSLRRRLPARADARRRQEQGGGGHARAVRRRAHGERRQPLGQRGAEEEVPGRGLRLPGSRRTVGEGDHRSRGERRAAVERDDPLVLLPLRRAGARRNAGRR
jgi:hypothetical protein